jgi:hypothetical protein
MNTLRSKLYTLIKQSVGLETLIFADQNAPRPVTPYWTLRLDTQNALGHDEHSNGVDNDGDLTITGVREATLNVQRIGVDSPIVVANFRDQLSKQTVRDLWAAQGITCYNVGAVQNLPFEFDEQYIEPRGIIDLFIRFAVFHEDRVGIIETVNVTQTED